MTEATGVQAFPLNAPDTTVNVRETFGIDVDMDVPAFSKSNEYVPDRDETYRFDKETTLAILAGFAHNRRVMVQGYHGTGKSSHIEQVASRLNWPCVRVNLDSHISRIDLVGKDAIVLKDGKQVTEFREGILPWALQHPCALVFDEYDAGQSPAFLCLSLQHPMNVKVIWLSIQYDLDFSGKSGTLCFRACAFCRSGVP